MGAPNLTTPGSSALLGVAADHAFGGWRDFLVVIWRGETTMEGIAELEAHLAAFAAGQPDGVVLVTIVERRAPLPPGKVRDALARFMARSASIRASGVVFEGSGFRASAVRSVVTGLTMLAKQPYPHKVFATVEQASVWLVEETNRVMGRSYQPEDLIGGIEAIRREIASTS